MTLTGCITMFLVLAGMAALPSSSVALVVARSALSGVRHGLAVAAGIVAGDLIFMAMAILSMAALASQLGTLFALIKYAAALYLIWFGAGLIRSQFAKPVPEEPAPISKAARGGLPTSFAAGLLLTLGDIKAIFFYASLLPTFTDLGPVRGGYRAALRHHGDRRGRGEDGLCGGGKTAGRQGDRVCLPETGKDAGGSVLRRGRWVSDPEALGAGVV